MDKQLQQKLILKKLRQRQQNTLQKILRVGRSLQLNRKREKDLAVSSRVAALYAWALDRYCITYKAGSDVDLVNSVNQYMNKHPRIKKTFQKNLERARKA